MKVSIVLMCLCAVTLADEKKVAEHTNHFALDVYKKITESGKNLVFSPFSLAIVLTFLWEGAGGNTATEIMKALHYDQLSHDEIDAYYKDALDKMKSSADMDLTLANSMWTVKGFTVKADFVEHLTNTYSATQNEFTADGNGLAQVNKWVKDNTKGKIEKILEKFPPNVVMLLMNAIYFKGKWVVEFSKTKTTEMDFMVPGNAAQKVQMMTEESKYEYADDTVLGAQLLNLYYQGNTTRLMVFLPKEGTTLEQLEAKLTTANFKAIALKAVQTKVKVYLPKFKLSSTMENLQETLKKLNINDAFGSANFTGISDTPIKVSQIIQKAIIEVNEEGTVAAAVTAAVITKMSAPMIPIFNANRPFLYVLHHVPTETILFMGRYAKVE